MTEPYRIFVVLDRAYGEKQLADLACIGPVWIVETLPNRAVAEAFWAAHPGRSHLNGVTTFKSERNSLPEDILANEIDTVDLHHDTFSANPPYSALEVIGAQLNETVKSKLSGLGFCEFKITPEGFRAVRRLAGSR